jgi:hypothetical protein
MPNGVDVTLSGMYVGVSDSAVCIVFLTVDYFCRPFCRKELLYACYLKKPLVIICESFKGVRFDDYGLTADFGALCAEHGGSPPSKAFIELARFVLAQNEAEEYDKKARRAEYARTFFSIINDKILMPKGCLVTKQLVQAAMLAEPCACRSALISGGGGGGGSDAPAGEGEVKLLRDQLNKAQLARALSHNKQVDMQGAIRLFLRIRPLKDPASATAATTVTGPCTVCVRQQEGAAGKSFACNRAFDGSATQQEVFDAVQVSRVCI